MRLSELSHRHGIDMPLALWLLWQMGDATQSSVAPPSQAAAPGLPVTEVRTLLIRRDSESSGSLRLMFKFLRNEYTGSSSMVVYPGLLHRCQRMTMKRFQARPGEAMHLPEAE